MLHLHLSNDLRRLVERLSARLPQDPLACAFAQPVVVIPDLATGTFSVKDGASEVLRAGDTIALSVQVDGAGFASSEFAFDFSDNDGFSIA